MYMTLHLQLRVKWFEVTSRTSLSSELRISPEQISSDGYQHSLSVCLRVPVVCILVHTTNNLVILITSAEAIVCVCVPTCVAFWYSNWMRWIENIWLSSSLCFPTYSSVWDSDICKNYVSIIIWYCIVVCGTVWHYTDANSCLSHSRRAFQATINDTTNARRIKSVPLGCILYATSALAEFQNVRFVSRCIHGGVTRNAKPQQKGTDA